jgi:single-strand DNA-binding protein
VSGLAIPAVLGPPFAQEMMLMANLNKVMLIGRLTRDPEVRAFANGGKVAKIGFAVNTRRKNNSTGEYEDTPVFIDIDAFNTERRKLADLVEQYLRKGHQAYVEGSLMLDQWTDKEGQKRSKLKVILDNVQFLEPRADGGEGGMRAPRASAPAPRKPAPPAPVDDGYDEPTTAVAPQEPHGEEEIPF